MTKVQRILDALYAMGRPATAQEISVVSGVPQASVSSLLIDKMQYSTCPVSVERIFRDSGGVTNYYSIKKLRPMEQEEIDWHLRGIERYGLEKWADIVDREPEDMMEKMGINKSEGVA